MHRTKGTLRRQKCRGNDALVYVEVADAEDRYSSCSTRVIT
jgi:hypothetical protein